MVHDETARLVGNLTTNEDLVGVYYDEDQNRLNTYPVLGFASWEEFDNEGYRTNNLYPIILLDGGPIEEDIELNPESDFLGVCKASDLNLRKFWEEDIEILRSMRTAYRETR